MASLTTCCHGDEPGTALGVVSGTVGGVCNPKTHSASVRVQGKWAIRHADEWWMNNRNTVGKLYWVTTTETPGPTPAIILAQNPEMEAPSPILLAEAGPNWVNFLFPEGTPAPPAAEHVERFAPKSNPGSSPESAPKSAPSRQPQRTPGPRYSPQPNRIARTPSFKPTPPPGYRLNATGALVRLRKLTPWGLAAWLLFHQNSPNPWRDEVWIDHSDPVERGLIDLADQAVDGGSDVGEVGAWLRKEIDRYRKEKQEADTIAPPEADRTTETVTVTQQRRQRRPCIVMRFGSLSCPAGEQAHHIVPDSVLRYGNRPEGESGQKRIPGMPAFRDGMAICLAGNPADRTGEHGIAHSVTDPLIRASAQSSPIPGTTTLGAAVPAGIAGAAAARPECTPEIAAAIAGQFGQIDSGRLVNAMNRPATGAALQALMRGQ
jgi:hypothetical protein